MKIRRLLLTAFLIPIFPCLFERIGGFSRSDIIYVSSNHLDTSSKINFAESIIAMAIKKGGKVSTTILDKTIIVDKSYSVQDVINKI